MTTRRKYSNQRCRLSGVCVEEIVPNEQWSKERFWGESLQNANVDGDDRYDDDD